MSDPTLMQLHSCPGYEAHQQEHDRVASHIQTLDQAQARSVERERENDA